MKNTMQRYGLSSSVQAFRQKPWHYSHYLIHILRIETDFKQKHVLLEYSPTFQGFNPFLDELLGKPVIGSEQPLQCYGHFVIVDNSFVSLTTTSIPTSDWGYYGLRWRTCPREQQLLQWQLATPCRQLNYTIRVVTYNESSWHWPTFVQKYYP